MYIFLFFFNSYGTAITVLLNFPLDIHFENSVVKFGSVVRARHMKDPLKQKPSDVHIIFIRNGQGMVDYRKCHLPFYKNGQL